MKNKHPALCPRCGRLVPPGGGVVEKLTPALYREVAVTAKTKWVVRHADCAAKTKAA